MGGQDTALVAAGIVGGVTAVIHGVLMQRMMIRPIDTTLADDPPMSPVIRKLVAALLHYSTASWLLGGLALIAAARLPFSPDARLATGLIVGGHYLYGVIGNAWATRGRHPGWMLLAAAVGLIAYALYGPAA